MGMNTRLVRGDFRQVTCDVCGKESGEMYTTGDKGEVGDYDICVDCLLDVPYTLDEDESEEDLIADAIEFNREYGG